MKFFTYTRCCNHLIIFIIHAFLQNSIYFVFGGLRKFIFGFNGAEFTYDALIAYQAMTCGFNIHFCISTQNFRLVPNEVTSCFVVCDSTTQCFNRIGLSWSKNPVSFTAPNYGALQSYRLRTLPFATGFS